MYRILPLVLLLLGLCFSAQTQVVTFDNNWGESPLFNLVSETPNGVEVVFSTHKMVIEERPIDGVLMKTFGIPGIFLFNDEGAPNLAGTGRYIAIPQGAGARITILDSRTEVHHDIEVAPAPNIPFDSDDSPLRYVKNMQIYSRNAHYPESPVKLSEPFKIRGVDVVMLGITPFQYNPVTKELVIYKDIRVRVDFIGGNGNFGEDRLRSRFWEPILQANLLNYNSLRKIDFYGSRGDEDPYGYEYVIIVPDDPVFEAWADTIKIWRTLQGISSEVFTLTEIGGSSAAAIEDFLNNAYENWDIPPVAFLLLSDYPEITSPMWSSYCVSDNIYADVDEDDLPDMHHARICAETEDQLSIMVNKFLSHERDPYTAPNFYNEPLLACGWQTSRWFQLCVEVIRGFFINELGKDPAREYAIYSGNPTPGCAWSTATNTEIVVDYWSNLGYIPTTNPYDATWWNNGSSAGITNAINSGAFIVQHRDHGGVTGWGEPPYSNDDLDNLTNTMYPFVYSTNCLTGKYNSSIECFAEKFHRIEYGTLGINAASAVSYSFVNDTYVWGTYDYLWPEFMPDYPSRSGFDNYSDIRPCMAMTYGKLFLEASSWPYNTNNKVHTYHLFHHHGDAFTSLYTEIPQYLTVSHDPTLSGSQTSFIVTANSGSVIALTVNREIIGVAEGTGSPVTITIPPQTPGDTMIVTVTKTNCYRYEQDVPIISHPYQSGWPIATTGSIISSPVIGDLDRDGDLEIVVVSGTDVCAFKADGSQYSDWPQQISSSTGSSEATLGDIDADGILEIVVNAPDRVYAWNENATQADGWPKYTTNFVNYAAIISDIDGSGDLDEIVAGDDDGVLNVWTGSGDNYYGFPLQYSGNLRRLATGKVVPHTMFPPYKVNLIFFEQGIESFIHRWPGGGYWPQSFNGMRVLSPVIGDIDADGNLDVVVVNDNASIHIWDYNGINLPNWPKDGISFYGFPAIGDIDGDKDLEIVVWGDNKVYVYNKEGNLLPNWPQEIDVGDFPGSYSFAIGDIDGDGAVEIIAAGFQKIYAWHSNGVRASGFPILIPGGVIFSSPALGDMDSDGDVELIIGSIDGVVYVWDLSGTYDPANVEWPMFQRIRQKTGCYPQVTIAVNPHQYEVPQGGTFDFSVELVNHTDITEALTVWIEVNYNGNIIYRSQEISFNMSPFSTINNEVHQLVPDVAPSGIYTYKIKVGIDQNQLVVADRGVLYFKVVPNRNDNEKIINWELLWDDEISQGTQEDLSQGQLPAVNYLYQSIPNPFGRMTEIKYQLKEKSTVILKVFNVLGQEIKVLENSMKEPGYYSVTWDGKDSRGRKVAKGIYFVKMKTGDFEGTRKMLMLR